MIRFAGLLCGVPLELFSGYIICGLARCVTDDRPKMRTPLRRALWWYLIAGLCACGTLVFGLATLAVFHTANTGHSNNDIWPALPFVGLGLVSLAGCVLSADNAWKDLQKI